MAHVRKIVEVSFPFNAAVTMAAKQNVRRDYLKGIIDVKALNELTGEKREKYIADAKKVLMETGKNHLPVSPEYQHICVENWSPKKE